MANYEAHTRTRTVGPRTQHGSDRKEQATSHSKNTTSMYVAMLISVTIDNRVIAIALSESR